MLEKCMAPCVKRFRQLGNRAEHYETSRMNSRNEWRWLANTPVGARNLGMEQAKRNCKLNLCANSAVISFESLDLCLEHFLSGCYERLDNLEPLVRTRSLEDLQRRVASVFLEESSNCALLNALHQQHLTNLDRSRLLHILLMTRDLQLLLKQSLGVFDDSFPHASAVH
jgi:hypothetical protein